MIELAWIVPETEKGIQEIARDEKMQLISPESFWTAGDRAVRWRFAR